MDHEPTIGDVLEAVNSGFQGVQEQLNGIHGEMDGVKNRLTSVEGQLASVESRLTSVEGRLTNVEPRLAGVDGCLTNIETNMVTKDFLERRFEKTDSKINVLVHVLAEKRVLTESDRNAIRLA